MIFGPWMKYGGHPLALGLLFGAVVGALTGLMRLFAPSWDGTPLVFLCVLATLAGYYSYHFIQHSLLCVSTGLSYVGLRELLDLSRLSAVGVLPNVLLYFLLGTAMLAQVHYALQRYRWQEQGLAVAPTVSRRWTSYSLAFLGLAILLAALLPTRYTLGLLDVLRAALGLLILAAQFVLFLILYVFMWLLSLVLPAVQVPSAPVMPAGPLTPPAPLSPDGAGGGSDWLG